MSLVEQLHAAHKVRLARMGGRSTFPEMEKPRPVEIPQRRPSIQYPNFNIQTLYYHQMWFFDLVAEHPISIGDAPRIEQIQRAVANHFDVSKVDLLSARRTADIVRPRQIAMYLCKTLTSRSLPEIGRHFGGRDHTTVLHAVRKITLHLSVDQSTRAELAQIKAALQ